jgi:3-methyladenine DNA glycosylase AlkD
MEASVDALRARLVERADPKTRAWWEGYLKGEARFLGVKMADVREVMHAWRAETLGGLSWEAQGEVALALAREPETELKLAGALCFQEALLPSGALSWETWVPRWAALLDEGALADWNSCDWFCVKVLGPAAQRWGEPCARAIAGWCLADNLWRRRASVVAFVNLAKHGERNFEGFAPMLLGACGAVVRDPARFAQTGTGWALRELGRAEPEAVLGFVEERLGLFSREGLRYALEKMPADAQRRWLEAHKALGG